MRRLFIGMVIACMLFAAAACSNGSAAQPDRGELYSLTLDAMMPEDEGLNSGMTYIAIDMRNFEGLDEGDKQQILDFFADKYKLEAMDATYEQLIEKGLLNKETQVLDGVLLRVEKTEMKANSFAIEGSKYRAGDGAIGMKVVATHKQGEWKVSRAEGTWIS
ncbi:hypothetical protein PCCS19_00710 [Paenibacillus sp. CCS19]|nr:hypothetical protein PCCS19_00710 [Paenibacillus cellulosilyticus]